MIIKYIVCHILYDRNLYECIQWGFCACLKEAWGCTPIHIVEYIAIVQQKSIQIRKMRQLERDTGLEYHRGGWSVVDWDQKASQWGMT